MTVETKDKKNRRRTASAILHPVRAPIYPVKYDGRRAVDRTHIAGYYYPDTEPPKEYAIYYAVEVKPTLYDYDDGNKPTIEKIGLKNGVFRWITGAPGFNRNSNIELKDETGRKICNSWYEGVLLKGGLSNPNRKIDIKDGGDYATLSGFNFAVRNDNAFWQILEQNKIYITNSSVKVFAVLDKTFYSLWQGVVKSTSYTETDFEFKCESNFKAIHKTFPPQIITEATFPEIGNINQDALGQTIPVCLGEVPYAKGLYVKGDVEAIAFNKTNGGICSVFAAWKYEFTLDNPNQYKLTLKTDNIRIIHQNELAGRYLRVMKGDGEDYYLIERNDATNSDRTVIYLDGKLEKWESKFGYPQNDASVNSKDAQDVWFFQIVEAPPIRYIVSQKPIELKNNNTDNEEKRYYNYKDKYQDVGFAVRGTDFTNEPPYFFTIPEKAAAAKIDEDEIIETVKIERTLVIPYNTRSAEVEFTFSPDKTWEADQFHLGVNMDWITFTDLWDFTISAYVKDGYGRYFGPDMLAKDGKPFLIGPLKPIEYRRMNMVSNEYYSSVGSDLESLWPDYQFYGDNLEIEKQTQLNTEEIRKTIDKIDGCEQKIQLKIVIEPVKSEDAEPEDEEIIAGMHLFIKQICFSTSNRDENEGQNENEGQDEDEDPIPIEDETREWIKIGKIEEVAHSPRDASQLYNKKRQRTRIEYSRENFPSHEIKLNIDLPSHNKLKSAKQINLCMDADIACYSGGYSGWNLRLEAYRIKKVNNNYVADESVNLFQLLGNDIRGIIGPISFQNCGFNFAPNESVENNADSGESIENEENDNDEFGNADVPHSLWPMVSQRTDERFQDTYDIKEMTRLNDDILELIRTGVLTREFCIKIALRARKCEYMNPPYNNPRKHKNDNYNVKCPYFLETKWCRDFRNCVYYKSDLRSIIPKVQIKQIKLIGVTKRAFEEDGVYVKDVIGEYSEE